MGQQMQIYHPTKLKLHCPTLLLSYKGIKAYPVTNTLIVYLFLFFIPLTTCSHKFWQAIWFLVFEQSFFRAARKNNVVMSGTSQTSCRLVTCRSRTTGRLGNRTGTETAEQVLLSQTHPYTENE